MSDTVTLYQSLNTELGESLGVAGEFRRVQWCKTHDDQAMKHLISFDGRRCRWALRVDGTKPCDVVDVWREVS